MFKQYLFQTRLAETSCHRLLPLLQSQHYLALYCHLFMMMMLILTDIDDDKIDDRKHHLSDDMAPFLTSICHLAMMMTLIMVLKMMIE